jgi:hypothetical protein
MCLEGSYWRDHLGDLEVDGMMVQVQDMRSGLKSSGSGRGAVAVSCEHGNEPSGFVIGGEFFDQINDY